MGQCAGGSAQSPSALKLCEAFEQQWRSRGPSSRSNPPSTPASPPSADAPSIWQLVTKDEITALGEIVGEWSVGFIDSSSARVQIQARVLRNRSGTRPLNSQRQNPSASNESRPGAREGQSQNRHQEDQANPMETMVGNIFAGLMAAFSNNRAENQESHEVFATIDSVLFCRSYREAHFIAMRILGIDGQTPLPQEVRASFQEKATDIVEAPNVEENTTPWLDLVRLCLCVEVVRHLKSSTMGRPMGHDGSFAPGWQTSNMPMSIISQEMSGDGDRNIVLVSSSFGDSGAPGFISLRIQPGPGMGQYRINPIFLRQRVNTLLEALLADSIQNDGAPRGMSPAELDRLCPVHLNEACDLSRCPVCLEDQKHGEEVRSLPCGHYLHSPCATAWLTTADTCPTCRCKVRPEATNQ
jgi:hypothetical protein